MRNHGTDPATRMWLAAERVAAMKTIWTHEEATFLGEFVRFDRIWCWPKPVQRPHPPVLVGGEGRTVLDRVLAFGDAWFPNFAPGGDILARAERLRTCAERPIDVMVMGVPAEAEVLESFMRAGFRRVVHWVASTGMAAVEEALERWGSAIAGLTGES